MVFVGAQKRNCYYIIAGIDSAIHKRIMLSIKIASGINWITNEDMLCPFFLRITDATIPATQRNGMMRATIQKMFTNAIYTSFVASMVLSDAICKNRQNKERGQYKTPKITLNTVPIVSSFFIFSPSLRVYLCSLYHSNSNCQYKNHPSFLRGGYR